MAQAVKPCKLDPDNVSPLNLAFIGDSVYEAVIRTKVLEESNSSLKDLNLRAGKYTNAKAQCEMARLIESELTEHEAAVFKRGRNAKSLSAPKSCSIGEYRQATGFESLIGYLYLCGNAERIDELTALAVNRYENRRQGGE